MSSQLKGEIIPKCLDVMRVVSSQPEEKGDAIAIKINVNNQALDNIKRYCLGCEKMGGCDVE